MSDICETVTIDRGGSKVRINKSDYDKKRDGAILEDETAAYQPVPNNAMPADGGITGNPTDYTVKEVTGKYFIVTMDGKKAVVPGFDGEGYADAPTAIAAIEKAGFTFVPSVG